MKSAKTVFTAAGIWGLFVRIRLYVMFEFTGRSRPPAITHPDSCYGIIGLGVARQFAFLIFGRDPARYRPIRQEIPPAR